MDEVRSPSVAVCCAAVGGLHARSGPTRPRRSGAARRTRGCGVATRSGRGHGSCAASGGQDGPDAVHRRGHHPPAHHPQRHDGLRGPASRRHLRGRPGICTHVRARAVAELPLARRVAVKPPTSVIDIRASLDRAGIAVERVDFALPTHLHWDHVAGLLDLPQLPLRVHSRELAWAMSGDVAPVGGVRSAVRGRPTTEYELHGPPVLTFTRSHDLLGDGSVCLVDLGGHTPGSVGILLRTAGGPVLLAGDAAWHGLQVQRVRQKASYPGMLADDDRPATFATLHRLHAIRSAVRVVPSHDHDAAQALR